MFKFQTIRAVTSFENDKLKLIKLNTLVNSKIVKIEFIGQEDKLYYLDILTQKELSNFDRKESVLKIVKNDEEIEESIYLDSFISNCIEYHVCLLKN